MPLPSSSDKIPLISFRNSIGLSVMCVVIFFFCKLSPPVIFCMKDLIRPIKRVEHQEEVKILVMTFQRPRILRGKKISQRILRH